MKFTRQKSYALLCTGVGLLGTVGPLVLSFERRPAWFLITVGCLAALLVSALVLSRRTGKQGGWSVSGGLLLTGLLLGGGLGVLVPVFMARGLDHRVIDIPALLVLCLAGIPAGPRGGRFWFGGIIGGTLLGAMLLWTGALNPVLPTGVTPPDRGGEIAVTWGLEGARGEVRDPLDPPVRFHNTEREIRTVEQVWFASHGSGLDDGVCPAGTGATARIEELTGRPGMAVQRIAEARSLQIICPDSPFARIVLGGNLLRQGIAHMRTGTHAQAVKELTEAIPLLPRPEDKARAHLALARAFEGAGDQEAARKHYRAAVKAAPDHPAGRVARNNLP